MRCGQMALVKRMKGLCFSGGKKTVGTLWMVENLNKYKSTNKTSDRRHSDLFRNPSFGGGGGTLDHEDKKFPARKGGCEGEGDERGIRGGVPEAPPLPPPQ